MNGRWIIPGTLIALVLATQPALAQPADPTETSSNPLLNQYGAPFRQPLGPGLENPPPPAPPLPPVTTLSPYIMGVTSHPDGCCGPGGRNGPISWELYARSGTAVSFGNPFAGDLNLGWAVQGGARTLFFDQPMISAWVLDLGITNIYQTAGGDHTYRLINFPEIVNNQHVTLPQKFLTGDYLNRTLVGASIGRECWLIGSARHPRFDEPGGWNWRAGWDVGGRWGNAKFMPNEARHLHEVVGGIFVAAHSDLEFSCGACVFQFGFRMEYGYTWNDVIQSQNRADVQDLLFMWNSGVRF